MSISYLLFNFGGLKLEMEGIMIQNDKVADLLQGIIDRLQQMCDQIADKGLYTFNAHYGVLTLDGVASALIYMALMVGLAYFFYKKKKALDFCDRYLTYAFIAVWMLGFVVYDLGMYPDHCASGTGAFWAMLGVAPMAIIHAFEMFILQSDVSAIHEGCHNSAWFMFFFSIAHLLAAFISMVFVIKHFSFNIVANAIRIIKTHFWMKDMKELYVFWGMNDATYHLAKNIIDTKHDSDARIIIIRMNNDKDDSNKPIGMDRLFSFLSLSNKNLDNLQELQKLGCLTSSTFGSLTDVQMNQDNDLIRYELRLNSIVRLMDHTTEKIHMFFFDNDEAFNIQAVGNLKRDKSINTYVINKKITFYYHARYDSVHRVIETPSHKNMEIKVIDSSHLSVEILKLKENIDLQPVSYVNIEDDATVSTPFNALIVGFSEVGLDMLRMLYEFGAFVKTDSTNEQVTRSDFHCDIVDKNMASIAGLFVATTPSISSQIHLKNTSRSCNSKAGLNTIIDLYEMDCQSLDFYDKLKDWLPKLNYIVLATGDDELNMSHAVRIFRLAVRDRKDMERLRIMVRIKQDENGHFKKIAEHYNRLWAAEGKSTADEKRLHQRVIESNKIVNGPITIFGLTANTYTLDHIVDESVTTFKEKYNISLSEILLASGQNPNPFHFIQWDDERNNAMQLIGDYQGFSPTLSEMMRLSRVQNQNIANALHATTKVMLAKEALKGDYNSIKEHGLSRSVNDIVYRWGDHSNEPIDHIQRVMDVLAQTEHLRWVASHEILGYQRQGDTHFKDETKLLHGCMCDWNELPTETKSYDYNAVDVSIGEYNFE